MGRAIAHALPAVPGGNAAAVLLVMAHHARDADSRPVFHKGDDYLAQKLGYRPGDESGTRVVRRARAHLLAAGFIEPDDKKRPLRFIRRWALTLPADDPLPDTSVR